MRIAIVLNEQGEPAEFAADGEIELLIIRRPAAAREHAPVIPASARGLAAAVAAPVTVAYQAVTDGCRPGESQLDLERSTKRQ
jgi:hypothetical protein